MATRRPTKVASTPRLSVLFAALGAVGLLLSSDTPAMADPGAQKLVVVVYPDESDGAPGIILVNHAIRSTFASQSPGRIDVRNEYVDTARRQDAAFMQAQVSLLRQRYAGRKIDLVIAGLSSGLDFVLQHRAELFPGVPIVFVAVDDKELRTRRLPPDVIGVPIRMELAGTIDVALRLHPDTRRVFVIAGAAPFDTEWEAEARRTFQPYEQKVEFVYLAGLTMSDLLERVASLPEQSIIYYLHIHRDGAGKPFFPAEALERVASRANAPIYGHVDTYVGRGIVGGRVFTFETEGLNAARLGLRILAGEKPESIPSLAQSENSYIFDWRQLRRWGIGESHLPPGSIIRFRDYTFWDVYKWHILGGIAVCLVEAMLIAGLLIQLIKRRRAEQQFRQVIETASTGMLIVGRDGAITMANTRVEQLFGYTREELQGQPMELIIPELAHGLPPVDRMQCIAEPQIRSVELERDLSGRRKDGTEFPIEIELSPLATPRGLFVLASIIDLTKRRRAEAELRASQQELQHLTRRLLEAQEAERRRIARELHDDFNQCLALVAVELDLLACLPPESQAKATARVRELSARVKELSSSVHSLSHQLHPSKLEQLGLVVAIRSLCKELDSSHGLEVKFTHYPDPGVIPQETALCLYRIVQEALRNVLKHSGSRYAAVELSGSPNTVLLRVTDDGAGFDPLTVRGGLGLVSMRERLRLVGGEIVIDSHPSCGTRINVRVPTRVPRGPDTAEATPATEHGT